MNNKKDIKFGEIYLVNFNPSVGHEYQGKRPAIVIESNNQIKRTNLVTVLPLTSNLSGKMLDDILVKVNKSNNLYNDSMIKVYSIISFDYSRFIKRIGIVDKQIMVRIKNYLKKHFDL